VYAKHVAKRNVHIMFALHVVQNNKTKINAADLVTWMQK